MFKTIKSFLITDIDSKNNSQGQAIEIEKEKIKLIFFSKTKIPEKLDTVYVSCIKDNNLNLEPIAKGLKKIDGQSVFEYTEDSYTKAIDINVYCRNSKDFTFSIVKGGLYILNLIKQKHYFIPFKKNKLNIKALEKIIKGKTVKKYLIKNM